VLDGDPRVLIPLPEAAERLGISRWQAYKLARSGRLPTTRLGARDLYVPAAVLRRIEHEGLPQVVEVRYQAGGQFGSGFKGRPKSDAGIRELPLAPLLVESIRRQLPPDADPEVLVFTGPGGGNGVPAGSRTMLSRYNFRRVYQRVVARAGHDLAAVDPHGPHDLRHTFSTWLEDAGIPARVIDELMGHERSRRGELEGGSRVGARYRHTTPEMAVRVAAAIQERLVVVVQIAEVVLELDDAGGRVF
jgi:excisionase family DNA binding protein